MENRFALWIMPISQLLTAAGWGWLRLDPCWARFLIDFVFFLLFLDLKKAFLPCRLGKKLYLFPSLDNNYMIFIIWEICSLTYFFEIGAGGTTQLIGPSTSSTYKHHFSLTAQIIFHKLTIIPSINPTSLSTFFNKSLFCQSLSSPKL
jgi:hypothetical protein